MIYVILFAVYMFVLYRIQNGDPIMIDGRVTEDKPDPIKTVLSLSAWLLFIGFIIDKVVN